MTPPPPTTSAVPRIGFLGCGFIARYHAMQLRLAPAPHELAVVHDPDAERARSFAEAQGAAVAASVEELLAAVDAVFVCTWTATHRELVEAVAAAGLPLFCEKPLGTDLADARAVAAAARRCPLEMVGLVMRSFPAMLGLRELLADPDGGRVMNVVFRDDQFIPTQGMYDSQWRGDPALAGSGTMLEHSIHDVDVLEWLAGPLEAVSAQQAHFHDIEGIEDSVTALGRFASGASVSLTSVWHDILLRPSQRRIEVFRERELLTLEGDVFGPVTRHADGRNLSLDGDELVTWLREAGVQVVSAEQQFVVAVAALMAGDSPGPLRPGVDEALRAHVVVDAVYRSARSGGELVEVPDDGASG